MWLKLGIVARRQILPWGREEDQEEGDKGEGVLGFGYPYCTKGREEDQEEDQEEGDKTLTPMPQSRVLLQTLFWGHWQIIWHGRNCCMRCVVISRKTSHTHHPNATPYPIPYPTCLSD